MKRNSTSTALSPARGALRALLGLAIFVGGTAVAFGQTGDIVLDVLRGFDPTGGLDFDFLFINDQADFYCKGKVDAGPEVMSPIVSNKDETDLDCTITQTVTRTQRFFPVQIQLLDSDSFPAGPDDQTDINPAAGKQILDLIFDACRFTWNGDVVGGPQTDVVRGSGDPNQAETSFHITTADGKPFSEDDVAILNAAPVQVTFDPDYIAHGKPTSFRVDFSSSYAVLHSGSVTVTLRDGVGNTVSETRNVDVPPEGLTTYFFDGSGSEGPFVPFGSGNGSQFCWDVHADFGMEGPPGGGSPVFANCYGDNNIVLNQCKRFAFIDNPATIYLPFDWDTGSPLAFLTPSDFFDSFVSNERFRLATTPIPNALSFPLPFPLALSPGPPVAEPFYTMMVLSPAVMLSSIDRLVLMPRAGWFSDNISHSNYFQPNMIGISAGELIPFVVLAEANRSQVVAHEINHTYRLSRHSCDTGGFAEDLFDLGCRDEYMHFPMGSSDPYPASGFDVVGDVYPAGFSPVTPGTREVFTTNIMGTAGAPNFTFDRWIDDLNYNYLLREMHFGTPLVPLESAEAVTATTAISLSGILQAQNGIGDPVPQFGGELLPSFLMPIDNVNLALPEPTPGKASGAGPFALKLITPQGDRTYRFMPSFRNPEIEDPIDVGMFSFAAAWDDTTTRIELYGPTDLKNPGQNQDTLLAAIDRSAALPAIQNVRAGIDTVPTQAGPQPEPPTIPPGHTLALGWDIADADSSSFSTTLLLRPPAQVYDGLVPLAAGLGGNEFILPQAVRDALPTGDYGLTIVTSDGVNTSSFFDVYFDICALTNNGVEICDGLDNDCDGTIDNVAAPALAHGLRATPSRLSWDPVPGASGYDVIEGDLELLHGSGGDFAAATTGCLIEDFPTTELLDGTPPAQGGSWFLVRASDCGGDGSWDSGEPSQVAARDPEIDVAAASCPDCAHARCEAGAALDPACDSCVADICAADPFCCGTGWDSICVSEVRTVCGKLICDDSAGACGHSQCAEGSALVAVCDDPPVSPSCVSAVCAADSHCCDTAWDWICVDEIGTFCGAARRSRMREPVSSGIGDEDLHDGFLQGDPQATHHVQGWIDGVVHLGRWNFEDAEGVAQETVVKLLQIVRRGGWKRHSSFKTFVFSVAKYTCIDAYRRERLHGSADRPLDEDVATAPPQQQDSLEKQQQLMLLRFILQQLPSECLRLWNWTYREGLGAGEVGRRLGITAGNVRVRAHRCLQKARSLASDYPAGPAIGRAR